MDKFNAWFWGKMEKWQVPGIIFGLIIGHFQHHIALYNWLNKKVDEYHVVEHDSKWNPFD